MMKYRCNSCGQEYDERGRAAVCHPAITEITDESEYPTIYLREGQQFECLDGNEVYRYTLETIHMELHPMSDYKFGMVDGYLYMRDVNGKVYPWQAAMLSRQLAIGVMRLVENLITP